MDFEEYVAARSGALLRFARVLTGDQAAAEDLLQAAFVDAYTRWSKVAAAERPDAYLRRVIVNRHLSWRRRRSSSELVASAEHISDASSRVRDSGPDIAVGVADRDHARHVLATLAPRARTILVLRYYADLADAEIADVLGISSATVRAPHRGRCRPSAPASVRSLSKEYRMTDRAEQVLRQVFAEEASAAVVPSGLVEEVRRRVRRRRRMQGAAAALGVVVAAGAFAGIVHAQKTAPPGSSVTVPPLLLQPGPAVAVATVPQVRALVGGARLERRAVLGGGAVQLAPAAGQPVLDEVRAVRLWAASSPAGGQQTVAEPVVFLADVTVSAPLRPAGEQFGSVHQPRFEHRLAWVVVWSHPAPIYFCPYSTVHPTVRNGVVASSTPAPDAIYAVQMIAADASGESVVYSTASIACASTLAAHADIATYDLSLPWHATTASGVTRASVVVPDCADLGAISTVGTPASVQVQISAQVLMVRPPCGRPSGDPFTLTLPGPGGAQPTATRPPEHAPTGLLLGRVTNLTGSVSLSYFDGADHVLMD